MHVVGRSVKFGVGGRVLDQDADQQLSQVDPPLEPYKHRAGIRKVYVLQLQA